MNYSYDVIVVKPKINKKKIILLILIFFVIVSLSIFAGIKFTQYKNAKKVEENDRIEQEKIEQAKLEEQRLEEIELEKEMRKKKSSEPLSEEQLKSIENIYNLEEKSVFLTFDDGPTQAVTPFILDLLKQENIPATFFVLGNRAKANPDLIKREYDEGHYIANHGYTHVYRQIYANPQNVLDEYNYTNQCIQEALENSEYNSKIFRFPGGSVGGYYKNIKENAKQLLKENNIASLDWNSLSKDAEGAKTKEELLQNIIETSNGKQSVVILMHDASDKILTYETLPDVINYFRDNGYEFKNIYDV